MERRGGGWGIKNWKKKRGFLKGGAGGGGGGGGGSSPTAKYIISESQGIWRKTHKVKFSLCSRRLGSCLIAERIQKWDRNWEWKARVYLNERRAERQAAALWFFWHTGYMGHPIVGVGYSLGRWGLWVVFLNFQPSFTFPEGRGIFVLIWFYWKCHGVGVWGVLLICIDNFIIILL